MTRLDSDSCLVTYKIYDDFMMQCGCVLEIFNITNGIHCNTRKYGIRYYDIIILLLCFSYVLFIINT